MLQIGKIRAVTLIAGDGPADNLINGHGMLRGTDVPPERIRLTPNQDDAVGRASEYLARAMGELYQAAAAEAVVTREDLARDRATLQELAQRLEAELAHEKEQRAQMAGQLTNLAGSMDRLVNHLAGLSQLMAELLERLASPTSPLAAAGAGSVPEPTFQAGGEGIALSLTSVPGFQALMDFQKALVGMEQVTNASVERFQEDESRIQMQLNAPLTPEAIAAALTNATGHACVVEESRPELMRLRLKVVS